MQIAEHLSEKGRLQLPSKPHFLWITQFPLFTRADEDKEFLAKGRWASSHHPFTAPVYEDLEALKKGDVAAVSIWLSLLSSRPLLPPILTPGPGPALRPRAQRPGDRRRIGPYPRRWSAGIHHARGTKGMSAFLQSILSCLLSLPPRLFLPDNGPCLVSSAWRLSYTRTLARAPARARAHSSSPTTK